MKTTPAPDMETVIGLEVHLQFHTATKIFCGCANTFGQDPNTATCPVCLGLPGTLPVLNKKALHYAIRVALALNAQVHSRIKFDRKNYYYPDLPKGYQISQYDLPIAHNGRLTVQTAGAEKTIGIHRAHLEEDAGKLVHDAAAGSSLVDYNRTGTPLMEIVSEPDMRSPQEAYDYLQVLKLTLQYLDVSDCDMEKGSLRCDANISVRRKGDKTLGVKSEIKNLNSFKAVRAALEFEERRHAALLQTGEKIVQETRLWDEQKQITISMRSKEEAHDYRYFPEPDLVPFVVETETIDEVRRSLPESPEKKRGRLIARYGLSEYDTGIIIQDRRLADFFEECAALYPQAKKVANWIIGPLQQELHARKAGLGAVELSAKELTDIVRQVEEGVISNLAGKDVLHAVIETGKPAADIIREQGLAQMSDESALEKIIETVLADHQDVVAQIQGGKTSAMGFLVGQTMRQSQGKANPKKVGELIQRRLRND